MWCGNWILEYYLDALYASYGPWKGSGLSRQGSEFDPTLIHARFVVNDVAPGQSFLRVLRFSIVSIIPPMLQIHLNLYVALEWRTNEESPGTFQKQSCFGNRRALDRKVLSLLVYLLQSVKRCFIYKNACCLFESIASPILREGHFNQTTRYRILRTR
jgi:hypothetical protein